MKAATTQRTLRSPLRFRLKTSFALKIFIQGSALTTLKVLCLLDTFYPKVFVVGRHCFFEAFRILLSFVLDLLLDVVGGDGLQCLC